MSDESSERKMKELLERLDRKADQGLAQRTLIGRAIGRSEDKIHLATEQGIVAIPLSEIEDINPLNSEEPDLVAVDVRSADAIEARFQVNTFNLGLGQLVGDLRVNKTGATYTGFDCVDTCTITGGPDCDATDDTLGCTPSQQIDDYVI